MSQLAGADLTQILAIVKDMIKKELKIEISADNKIDYTGDYIIVTAKLKLNEETINSSEMVILMGDFKL